VKLKLHSVRKKDRQSSINNFNKYKRIFTTSGTHYSDPDGFTKKHIKFAFKIYYNGEKIWK